MRASRLVIAAGLAILTAGCDAPAAPAAATKGPTMTTSLTDRLARCAPRSATLILIEETLLTRTRVTAATAATLALPLVLAEGDRRLADLATALAGLAPAASTIAEFDPRTLINLTCADGTTLAIEGSATEDDGTIYLRIGDEIAQTRAPLRRRLDALAGSPATPH